MDEIGDLSPVEVCPATLRTANRGDVTTLVELIYELADFEHERDAVQIDADELATALFGESPAVFAHVAELDGVVVAMAVWFLSYSTWTGRHGIYLEDLYVKEHARGLGIGTALLCELARIANERGYRRFEWSVLDWNEKAVEFYRALGAVAMDAWTVHRVTGEALSRLGRDR